MICTEDLFGYGLAVYKWKVTIESYENVAYEDGSHVYLLNSAYTAGNADDAILEFLDCIRNNDTSTATYKTTLMREVCPAINEIREDPGKEAEYMTWQTKLMDVEYNALERGRIEGREEGREAEFLSTIKALHEAGQTLPFMEQITRRSKNEIVNGLRSLNLSIPS